MVFGVVEPQCEEDCLILALRNSIRAITWSQEQVNDKFTDNAGAHILETNLYHS